MTKPRIFAKPDAPENDFARRLDEACEKQGMSINKLAKATRVGAGQISRVRSRGALRISPTLLFAMADALGVDARWLFTGNGGPGWGTPAAAPLPIAPDAARLRERVAELEQALRVVETTSRGVLRR